MGLPHNWSRVRGWLTNRGIAKIGKIPVKQITLKNPEIPILENYAKEPPKDFWAKFPKSALPLKANSRIVVKELEDMLLDQSKKLKQESIRRGQTTVKNLKEGASAFQKLDLPPCYVENAKNAYEHGVATTDTIATWVKKGFACGPFNSPPVEDFRVNCLMSLPQGAKVRPVLNAILSQTVKFSSKKRRNGILRCYVDNR